ncbi:MAG: FesM [Anaerolineae bacterium]|nr:FesM [Anaerolineae bacterium]
MASPSAKLPADRVPKPSVGLDVLRLPLVGWLLRWRYGRLAFQVPLLVIALLMVYDGLTGPQRAGRNLATVGAWVHYRGLVILALLVAGNLFCMGCPFTLPRTLARRLSRRGRRWPKSLRGKWISIAGLFLIFWLYEWLDLWASPWLTAWLILAYFVASFALEALFKESPFCKYVCPLGAFNFVQSTASPLQITARDPGLCRTCVGKECVNGSYAHQPVIVIDERRDGAPVRSHENGPRGVLGCGTELFVPQMRSNMDCVFCLDCARACPHDNVALAVRAPGRELADPAAAPRRWDAGLLLAALAFMGLTNAFGMVPPVYALIDTLRAQLGLHPDLALFLVFITANLALPVAAGLGAAWATGALTGTLGKRRRIVRDTFAAFAPAFVPIGVGIWLAHYVYHFALGALSIIPVFHSFVLDHGLTFLGQTPDWSLGPVLGADGLAVVQVVALAVGYAGSLFTAWRIASRRYRGPNVRRAWLSWAILFLLMMLAALWLFGQPMEMRGAVGFDAVAH